MEKKKPKFLRRSNDRYSKLGVRRKKKQKWRRPTGRDNKMREKRRGYPRVVAIGYGKEKKPGAVVVMNVKDLIKVQGKEVVLGKIGKKNKIEIAKTANEKKIKIKNLNVKKFLKSLERKEKKETKKISPGEAKKILEEKKKADSKKKKEKSSEDIK